ILPAWGLVPGSSMTLAIIAAMLALFVAYVRAIGAASGAGQVFAGIMSKPKRMFVLSVVCVLHLVLPLAWTQSSFIGKLGLDGLALLIISAGCAITVLTRLKTIAAQLRAAQKP